MSTISLQNVSFIDPPRLVDVLHGAETTDDGASAQRVITVINRITVMVLINTPTLVGVIRYLRV